MCRKLSGLLRTRQQWLRGSGVRTSQRTNAVSHPRGTASRIRTAKKVLDATVGAQSQPDRRRSRDEAGTGRVVRGRRDQRHRRRYWRGARSRRRGHNTSARGRRGRRHSVADGQGQLHGLGERVGKRVGRLVVREVGIATSEQTRGAADDASGEHRDVFVGRRRQRMKADRAVGLRVPDALGHECVKMQIRIRKRTSELNLRDRSGLAACEATLSRAPTMVGEHDANEHGEHLGDQRFVTEQADAPPARERQRPLSIVGDVRKNSIHQCHNTGSLGGRLSE